jgi:hypothetical protein
MKNERTVAAFFAGIGLMRPGLEQASPVMTHTLLFMETANRN